LPHDIRLADAALQLLGVDLLHRDIKPDTPSAPAGRVDRTAYSPEDYRVRMRDPDEVDLAVLHQTGPVFAADKVRAHVLVMPTGEVLELHPPLTRLLYGSSAWNSRCVTIEHAGNFPGRYTTRGTPVWWRPELGADHLEERVSQVEASRALLASLRAELPALRWVGAHRQVQAGKAGCCGPDLWREIGEWAIRELGLQLVATHPHGKDIPDAWRRPVVIGVSRPR
jgi:hypothetical protein